ncbi:MAG: hypothetical protein AB7D05_06195 [Mangrovibacterium sp.]
MKWERHISKKLVLRLVALTAVMLAAVLFDLSHEGSGWSAKDSEQKSRSQFQYNHPVFVSPQASTYRVLKGADRLFTGFLFAATRNGFLQEYHNCRAFHILRVSLQNKRLPFFPQIHFLDFNSCHHCAPDDESPVV